MVAVPPRPVRYAEMPKPRFYEKLRSKERAELRRQYEDAQGGLCYYCQELLRDPAPERVRRLILDTSTFPEHFFRSLVHLHHDHGTGLTIGAVHAYCNAVLWQYHGE